MIFMLVEYVFMESLEGRAPLFYFFWVGGGGHWGSAPFATRSRARGAHALKGRNIVPTELAVGCSFFTCLNFSFKPFFFLEWAVAWQCQINFSVTYCLVIGP